ncbi:hypothetical protein MKY37_02230 [Psychrobacillus sp. FSL K6-2836]|uniref:hypothetical protein n=1 Tax=Psychrobacillus sp. FSL K6-2836 TaxID=2921548 RepID=UPI0030F9797C
MEREFFNKEVVVHFNELHQEQGLSLREIARLYDTSHGVIRRYLVKAGYSYRLRSYSLNEDYFKKLDSLEKLYFLGWIYSDGHVFSYDVKKHAGFNIKIQKRDEYILEYLKKLIESEAPVLADYTKGREYSKITFGSKIIYQDLLKYGLEHNKTFKIKYPVEHIWDHRPFILGAFDGDGSISIKKSNGMPQLSFNGTEAIVVQIKNILESELGVNPVKVQINRNTYQISYGGPTSVHAIAKWMYSWNPPIYLKRKRELINKCLSRDLYGKIVVLYKCPECGKRESFDRRNMYQLKKYFFKSKFCSLSCSGKFYRKFQMNGYKLSKSMNDAIKSNIIGTKKVYIKSKWDEV